MNLHLGLPNDDGALRLLRAWQPGAWIGAVFKAFGPMAELVEADEAVPGAQDTFEHRPAMWLVALWKPQSLQQPFLQRWPAMVQLTDRDGAGPVDLLLEQVPAGARLWVSDHDIDWALMAEIVMLTEDDLAPWQQRELAKVIVTQRQATATAITRHYVGQDTGDDDDFSPALPLRW